MKRISRRKFLGTGMLTIASTSVFGRLNFTEADTISKKKDFKISLAEWSLNKAYYAGQLEHLDFPVIAKKNFNINIVEYVSRFFKETNTPYLNELKKRAKDHGVKSHLIMVGGIGDLGESDPTKRLKNIEEHYKWIDIAGHLGCQSIRVNAYGNGSREDMAKSMTESLSLLGEYAAKEKINVIVENHGGLSSDVPWLLDIMKNVNMKNVGTLPDFGNFCIKSTKDGCIEEYSRYQGVQELLPYAKGISAKSYDFSAEGLETTIDYHRMFKIIKNGGFKGIIGIEYEGTRLSEYEGIKATKRLIENILKIIE